MDSSIQPTARGRVAFGCALAALLATLLLLPLSQRLPEDTGIPVFFGWILITLGGVLASISIGGTRRPQQATLHSRNAVILGCVAGLLFLAMLLYPMVLGR